VQRKILLGLCGSTRKKAKSMALLNHLKSVGQQDFDLRCIDQLGEIPLFDPNAGSSPFSESQKELITQSKGLVIVTPEYLHSIPSVLKSFLEWTNGESLLSDKKVYALIYTPTAPRGQYAKVHLEQVLKALGCRIELSELIHHTDLSFNDKGELTYNTNPELLRAIIEIIAS